MAKEDSNKKQADSQETTSNNKSSSKRLTKAQKRNKLSMSVPPAPEPGNIPKDFDHFDVYFKLGDSGRWSTKDNSVVLSIFPQGEEQKVIVSGKVGTDDAINYPQVFKALQLGILTRTQSPGSKEQEVAIVDLTQVREQNAQAVSQADRLLRREKEDVIRTIQEVQDVRLLGGILNLESKGHNRAKRRRESVINAALDRMEEITKKGGMFFYNEYAEEIVAEVKGQTGKVVENKKRSKNSPSILADDKGKEPEFSEPAVTPGLGFVPEGSAPEKEYRNERGIREEQEKE